MLQPLVVALALALGAGGIPPGTGGQDVETHGDVTVTTVPIRIDGAPVPRADALATPAPDDMTQADGSPLIARAAAEQRVVTDVLATTAFQTVGVTWASGQQGDALDLRVRAMDATGAWTPWRPLPVADDGPDVGAVEAGRLQRDGTDPLWVGEARAVQLSVASGAPVPADLSLTLVDAPAPGELPVAAVLAGAGPTGASTVATPPAVVSRGQWGARAPVCTPDVAKALVGAVVHHTAGSNDYATAAQAMQQIRGDQAYHIDGRGWCDLGYNFVVDKWGTIYEGRANSLTQAVVGVHAGGFNTGTVGVSMLGTYDAVPSLATQNAVAQIIGWRLGAYGVDPAGTLTYFTAGGENSRIPAGTTITLPRVFGHRDVAYTACPGNGGYASLPDVRAMAHGYAAQVGYRDAVVRVHALYRDMLRRDPEATGLAAWADRLVTVGAGPVSTDIARSSEYVTRRVVEAYREILRRDPDPTGLATWTTEISSGRLRQEDLRGRLIASDEYIARTGGTPSAYVAQLYRDILGREAAPQEVAYWVGRMATGGPLIAPTGVWYSLESAMLRVTETYATYLDRGPDPEGLRTWPTYWIANGENALRAGIVQSEEYRQRALNRYP